ncbi:class B sortase [Pygmaiobacter massiliensis]|uniref:class B sortase n=1 Tax=Pygmaiobacter massiliensis TaxID=1917873 RepID=UPI000C7DF2A2|nr:class B sortase [Pygmaiobacter massiliensis]
MGDLLVTERKKRKNKNLLIWVLAVLLIAVPAVLLGRIFLQYQQARQEYAGLAAAYTKQELQAGQTPLRSVDWEQLRAENKDVVGWIEMPALPVLNYPVVRGADDSFYLNHSYTGAYRPAGAIFMEAQNSETFGDLHTIVYGHNVKDGSMFGGLTKFKDKTFYEENGGSFMLYTPNGSWKYEIFSIEAVEVEDPAVYSIGFRKGPEYEKFLTEMKERSLYDTGVSVDEDDYVITLSTCVSGTSQTRERFVVHAKCTDKLA